MAATLKKHRPETQDVKACIAGNRLAVQVDSGRTRRAVPQRLDQSVNEVTHQHVPSPRTKSIRCNSDATTPSEVPPLPPSHRSSGRTNKRRSRAAACEDATASERECQPKGRGRYVWVGQAKVRMGHEEMARRLYAYPELRKYANRVRDCGQFYADPSNASCRPFPMYCDLPWICPTCAGRKAREWAASDAMPIRRFLRSKSDHAAHRLVLTVKHDADCLSTFLHLKECVGHLFARIARDRREHRGFTSLHTIKFARVRYSFSRGNEWHPHAHIILASALSVQLNELQDWWDEIAGGSCQIRLEQISRDQIPHVYLYHMRGVELSPKDGCELMIMMGKWKCERRKGFRFCQPYGDKGFLKRWRKRPVGWRFPVR